MHHIESRALLPSFQRTVTLLSEIPYNLLLFIIYKKNYLFRFKLFGINIGHKKFVYILKKPKCCQLPNEKKLNTILYLSFVLICPG